MKTFDELYAEIAAKQAARDPESGTVRLLDAGVHSIGKKLVEEAAESWMAAEHESRDDAATELSQLMYHVAVMALALDLKPEDLYERL